MELFHVEVGVSGPPGPGDSWLQNKPRGTEAPAGANRLDTALNSPDTTRPAGGSLVPCLPSHAPPLICPIDTWVCKLPQATATHAPHCPHLPFTRMPVGDTSAQLSSIPGAGTQPHPLAWQVRKPRPRPRGGLPAHEEQSQGSEQALLGTALCCRHAATSSLA